MTILEQARAIKQNIDRMGITRLEALALCDALIEAWSVMQNITKKVPEKVSREEAADMAIEFKNAARDFLTKHGGISERVL